MGIRITTKIIEARNHRVAQPLVDNIFAPEIAHAVLHPLKIRNGYSSGVSQDVRDHKDTLPIKYLISAGRRGSVCPFGEDLTFQTFSVLRSNLVFSSRRDQHVTVQFQKF